MKTTLVKNRTEARTLALTSVVASAFVLFGCASSTDTGSTGAALASPAEAGGEAKPPQEHLTLPSCNAARESLAMAVGEALPSFGCNAGSTCVMFGGGFEPEAEWGGKCLVDEELEATLQRLADEAGCSSTFTPDVGYLPRQVRCDG